MSEALVWCLRSLGAAFLLLGLAHLWLPRALRWPPVRSSATGELVVRMHSGYVALFVAALGCACLLAPVELLAGSTLARLVLGASVLTFALRSVAEVVWVGPALRRDGAPPGLRWLHRAALVAWPAATLVLAGSLAVALGV